MRLDDRVTDAGWPGWTAVVPVKSLSTAKSRLAANVPSAGALALAFLEDTIAAVTASSGLLELLVATSDATVADLAARAGCRVVSDAGHPGINAAARVAARAARPDAGIVVVVSDLPCLTPAAVETVLALGHPHRTSFLADADGTGTTMWLARPGAPVDPRFGAESARAHRSSGAVDLVAAHPRRLDELLPARRDVDTADGLALAERLGLGPATRRLLDDRVPPSRP
jgi:2-phospho-L-lactate/phosphoenolpyruvate guanylyltransferase